MHRNHGESPETFSVHSVVKWFEETNTLINSVNSVRNVLEAAFHSCPS